jgi:O-succinylbenzoic acid--CoA ligase
MKNPSPENFLLLKQNSSTKAIITSSIIYSFSQLQDKVFQRASILKAQNISSGDCIGIIRKNSIDFVIDILALWLISAIPVPINTKLSELEIDEQLSLANCYAVIVQEEFLEKLKNLNRKLIGQDAWNAEQHIHGKEEIKLTDSAVIIFTSGSTEKSKGIILSFSSLYNSALNSNQLLRYTSSDRWLASLPFYHIGGFSIITRFLVFGIPIIIPDSLSVDHLINSVNNFQPTFISLVSAQLKRIVADKIPPNPELKNCLIGGGFTDPDLLEAAYDIGWPINLIYGSTETSSFVTALLKDEITIKPNSVGRPVPTNNIKIEDEAGNELKQFEIGEILIQSNALMKGYLNSNLTSGLIKNGYYHTGDIGFLDDDGYLFLEGRKNYLISSGGENVNPVEVENALLQHPMIIESAVFPLRDKEWGEVIAAAIVLKDRTTSLTDIQLKDFLRDKISGFKIPKKIFIEEYLPKTELGKIEKNKLISRYKLTSL